MIKKEELAEEGSQKDLHHVALVMDGNRRWAKLYGRPSIEGHEEGRQRIEPIVKRAVEFGVDVVTFYTLSLENLKRPEQEVANLMHVLRTGFSSLTEKLIEGNARFHLLGDINRFPRDLQENFRQAEDVSKEKTGITVNLALAYEGRDEVVRAFHRIMRRGFGEEGVNEALIRENLDTAGQPDPDLVIRTGGRARLSGLMPLQTVYSEIYFVDVLWPDFTVGEFDKAILWWKQQVRTFGR